MYDSVTAAKIPTDAQAVAGYVDGEYAWTGADWDRFPNAIKVRIAVFPTTNDGDVLDCERGDATPEQCPAWIRLRQAAGVLVPTIYCAAGAVAAVQAACAGLTYTLWVADWTGIPHLYPGSVATQYAADGIYDLSLLAEGWPESVVPQVPQDYLDKFVLSGPYDWPGVVANLEGIIGSLQAQLAQPNAQLAADETTLGKIRAALA